MPRYVALDVIHRGLADSVQPGEIVPDTIVNMQGEEEPQDFDRLLDLGLAELAGPARKRQAAATSADDAGDEGSAPVDEADTATDDAPDGADGTDAAPADAPPETPAAKPRSRSKARSKARSSSSS